MGEAVGTMDLRREEGLRRMEKYETKGALLQSRSVTRLVGLDAIYSRMEI